MRHFFINLIAFLIPGLLGAFAVVLTMGVEEPFFTTFFALPVAVASSVAGLIVRTALNSLRNESGCLQLTLPTLIALILSTGLFIGLNLQDRKIAVPPEAATPATRVMGWPLPAVAMNVAQQQAGLIVILPWDANPFFVFVDAMLAVVSVALLIAVCQKIVLSIRPSSRIRPDAR